MITFTSSGYIEVIRDGIVLSRHRVEREAIESCAKNGSGNYLITYPDTRVLVTEAAVPVTGQINGAVYA